MFCSECGKKAHGKFCSHCGARLDDDGAAPACQHDPNGGDSTHPLQGDWSQVVDYRELIRYQEVRERIAAAAAEATEGFTGEQFLDLCEKALTPLTVVPLPYKAIAKFAQPFNAKLGMKTGKERSACFAQPPGTVLVGVLCSLARHGRKVKATQSLADGSTITAELPSDLFALEGSVIVTVRRQPTGGTWVEAATHIPGHLFDWGKSNRCLAQLLAEAQVA